MPSQISYRETKSMKRKDGKAKYTLRKTNVAKLSITDSLRTFYNKTYRKVEKNVNNG